jgi:hypothetical protein
VRYKLQMLVRPVTVGSIDIYGFIPNSLLERSVFYLQVENTLMTASCH